MCAGTRQGDDIPKAMSGKYDDDDFVARSWAFHSPAVNVAAEAPKYSIAISYFRFLLWERCQILDIPNLSNST